MAVGSGDALYIRIDEELKAPVSSDPLRCSIFRVPNHLRRINEMAYEPQVISIGPYHRGKDHLKAMEVYKKHYLTMLIKRNKDKTTLKEYVEALADLKEGALKYYSESPNQKDGEHQFVEMMLFDGCFVVELICKSVMEEFRKENDHLLTHFFLRTVMRDLLLIENQLPFFILFKLFHMTMPNEADQNFMHMAIDCFSRIMPGPCSKKIENHPGVKHMHLLGLLHDSCVSPRKSAKGVNPPPTEATCSPRSASSSTTKPSGIAMSASSSTTKPSGIARSASDSHLMNANPNGLESASSAKLKSKGMPLRRTKSFVRYSLPKKSDEEKSLLPLETEAGSGKSSKGAIEDNHHLQCSMKLNDALFSALEKSKEAILRMVKPKGHEGKNYDWQTIGSASELHEAGITFKKIEEEDRLFDITFEKGVMSIPTLKIVDDTESILRNLVAYEQCYKDITSRHFTDYIRFMDCLINTGKDVELLRRYEVIENRLGDNEVIAGIFNRICDAVLIAEDDCFYSEMFNKVNKHCRKRRNRWMANFRHNYVNTPWALISIIAAVILLLLTVQQSVYSIFDYHFHH